MADRAAPPVTWAVTPKGLMSGELYGEVVALCTLAYDEDFTALMATFHGSVHVLGSQAGRVVSHALWVTRWLQAGSNAPMQTAFVEAVATRPDCQRQGLGRRVMQRLIAEVGARGFELAALGPADVDWYASLGWERWKGPLSLRTGTGLVATPGEEIMIYRLPRTPPLDLSLPLSAEDREGEQW